MNLYTKDEQFQQSIGILNAAYRLQLEHPITSYFRVDNGIVFTKELPPYIKQLIENSYWAIYLCED